MEPVEEATWSLTTYVLAGGAVLDGAVQCILNTVLCTRSAGGEDICTAETTKDKGWFSSKCLMTYCM